MTSTVLLSLLLSADKSGPSPFITANALTGHVRFLASDALEGRGPATRGDRLAQQYVAAQFEAWVVDHSRNDAVAGRGVDFGKQFIRQATPARVVLDVEGERFGFRPLKTHYFEVTRQMACCCAPASKRRPCRQTLYVVKIKVSAEMPAHTVAGWSSQVAREAHNLEVAGSNPVPAIFSNPS